MEGQHRPLGGAAPDLEQHFAASGAGSGPHVHMAAGGFGGQEQAGGLLQVGVENVVGQVVGPQESGGDGGHPDQGRHGQQQQEQAAAQGIGRRRALNGAHQDSGAAGAADASRATV